MAFVVEPAVRGSLVDELGSLVARGAATPEDVCRRVMAVLRGEAQGVTAVDAVVGRHGLRDDDLADLYESLLDRTARGGRGAFYTPREEIDAMARWAVLEQLALRVGEDRAAQVVAGGAALDASSRAALDGLTVWDPACGAGSLLLGVHRVLDRLGIQARLSGGDVDPFAVELAAFRLERAGARAELACGDALAALGEAGTAFDIIIANPPYIRHEELGAARKRELAARARRAFGGLCLDGKSDLFVYFFLLGLSRLAPAGTLCFLTSNAWLDVAYGQPLRQLLAREFHVRRVVESPERRSFAAAHVNTVVTVVAGPRAPAAPVQFVRETERRVSPERLAVSAGWGAAYLRGSEILDEILAAPSLCPLGAHPGLTVGRGRRTGRDSFFYLSKTQVDALGIESEHLRPLVKSPADFRDTPPRTSRLSPSTFVLRLPADAACLAGTRALRYVRAAEARGAGAPAWYVLPDLPTAHLALPIAFHRRFFVVENDAGFELHQRFATVCLDDPALARPLAAILSSSLGVLQLEVFGRRSLGQGALDVPPCDWRQIRVPRIDRLDARRLEALSRAWDGFAGRAPRAGAPPIELDEAVLDGLAVRGRLGILRRAAADMTRRRLDKARSLSPTSVAGARRR